PGAKKDERKNEAAPRQPHAAAEAAGRMGVQTVAVPDIGDFKNVEVIEVLVKPGDRIAKEQSLITLESDKATMEIPSPGAGVVKELRVKVGDKVSQGSPVLLLDAAEAQQSAANEAAAPARS